MSEDTQRLRNAIILYGFLFVSLSGILSVAARPDLQEDAKIAIYLLEIVMAICSGWLGLGILSESGKFNIIIRLGIFGLTLAVSLGYILVVTALLGMNDTMMMIAVLAWISIMLGILSAFALSSWLKRKLKQTAKGSKNERAAKK